ncbi:hypothetical protein IFN73_09850 [Francisella tularensis subsp. holarctica]|nr:hypothetical protein [Francisella tularensis subsp. holarctica]
MAKVRNPYHHRTSCATHVFVKCFVSNDSKFFASINSVLLLLQGSKLSKKDLSRVMMNTLSKGSTLLRKEFDADR